jgi:2-oxoglutarate ferredoxin oxidoreductase subunit beta
VLIEAARHKGTSLVEVLQNCVIFNDDIHAEITNKELRDEHQIYLEHGKPMLFGKNKEFGLVQDGNHMKVAQIGNGISLEDVLVHDAKCEDPTRHYQLARMALPEFPIAMGVIRSFDSSVYEDMLYAQISQIRSASKIRNMDDLMTSGNTFRLE